LRNRQSQKYVDEKMDEVLKRLSEVFEKESKILLLLMAKKETFETENKLKRDMCSRKGEERCKKKEKEFVFNISDAFL
jgi:hypothetical protein